MRRKPRFTVTYGRRVLAVRRSFHRFTHALVGAGFDADAWRDAHGITGMPEDSPLRAVAAGVVARKSAERDVVLSWHTSEQSAIDEADAMRLVIPFYSLLAVPVDQPE